MTITIAVIPTKAGISCGSSARFSPETPAFAGVTIGECAA
jgi:hypothetical protein